MSRVLVVTELLSIVSEKVTETFDVILTEVSPSEGELDETVGGVVSVLLDVLLLLQEMKVKLKRNTEKIMSICLTWFPIGGLGEPNIYHDSGVFYNVCGILLGVCLTCEELVGVTHRG